MTFAKMPNKYSQVIIRQFYDKISDKERYKGVHHGNIY